MVTQRELDQEAVRLARRLDQLDTTIVFAESCTAGLVAATLARIPGISLRLCGSAVVYQIETKARWLGISRELLADAGAVSQRVAESMASGVLRTTPHAAFASAVTGHLGPDAPAGLDGVVYVAVAWESGIGRSKSGVHVVRHVLEPDRSRTSALTLRRRRQREAALNVIQSTRNVLDRVFR